MHRLITTIAVILLIPAAAFAAPRSGGDTGARLAQMCEAGSRDITALPVGSFRRIIGEDADKRAALDALATAAVKAAQDIKAACPAQAQATAPARLAAMQTRLEALIAAVMTVRPPLEKFYGGLSDEQREAAVAAFAAGRQGQTATLLDPDCGTAPSIWPAADVEKSVHPTEAQRASLAALQDAAAKAAELAKNSCPPPDLLTPTARLAALGKRLDVVLQGVKTLIGPLNDFYNMLNDGQKSRFDAISLPQTSEASPPKAKPTGHRRPYINLGYLIRRFMHGF